MQCDSEGDDDKVSGEIEFVLVAALLSLASCLGCAEGYFYPVVILWGKSKVSKLSLMGLAFWVLLC